MPPRPLVVAVAGRRFVFGAAVLLALSVNCPGSGAIAPADAQPKTGPPAPSAQSSAAMFELAGNLRESGEGVFTWFGLKIYRARFWVGPEGFDDERPLAAAFALELIYARAFEGRSIADRSRSEIEKLGLGSAARRDAWQADMRRIFPDVAPGDSLTGVYRPGKGTVFLHNGRDIGAIADLDFAAAFFAIWLDPRTPAPAVRKLLLAGAAPDGAARQ
jgi:Chalcone isomerase-like